VGIETDVYRTIRYAGASCSHALLLRATRPSGPNADQGALDAADAFVAGWLEHLQRWFESWWLPSLCAQAHTASAPEDDESGETYVDDPGFRWVAVEHGQAFFLTDSGRGGDLHGS
jgi:hypothetical protein